MIIPATSIPSSCCSCSAYPHCRVAQGKGGPVNNHIVLRRPSLTAPPSSSPPPAPHSLIAA